MASDGVSLRMYQAVIDARTLLMEIGPRNKDMQHVSVIQTRDWEIRISTCEYPFVFS